MTNIKLSLDYITDNTIKVFFFVLSEHFYTFIYLRPLTTTKGSNNCNKYHQNLYRKFPEFYNNPYKKNR